MQNSSTYFFIFIFLLNACAVSREEAVDPLPRIEEIREIKASYTDFKSGKQREFEVPREHWKKIRSSLLPAKRDEDPAKWEALGQLEITRKDGSRFEVDLFFVGEGPGAFAVEKSLDKRVYYRGGKTEDLMKALQAADPTLETKP